MQVRRTGAPSEILPCRPLRRGEAKNLQRIAPLSAYVGRGIVWLGTSSELIVLILPFLRRLKPDVPHAYQDAILVFRELDDR